MGGPKKIGVQHDRGRYTARERIDKLLNKDSFGLGDVQIFLWHGLPRRLALWIP